MAAPHSSDLVAAKRALRFACRAARAARLARAPLAAALLPLLPARRSVSVFLPLADEPPTDALIAALDAAGHGVLLPVVQGPGTTLVFRPWRPGEALEAGVFGTRFPAGGVACDPDWLLVPLLAFDTSGHRLGYGGGYYDRTLAGLRTRRAVVAVGLGNDADRHDRIPAGATDQRLDGVLTQSGLRWFGS